MNVSFAAGTTIAASVSPGAVGRLIVVTSGHDSVTATMTIADTAGNTWLAACPRRSQSGGGSLQTWYAIANGTGSTTITVTDSASTGFRNILIEVFDGNSATPLDNHTETSAASGSPTTTIVPVANDCLLYAASNDSITAVGSGFTKGSDDGAQDWAEYKALTGGAGGSQTANFTGSGAWILCVATFAPAGAGAAFIAEAQKPVLQAVNRSNTY
jgi:hypothetical protein